MGMFSKDVMYEDVRAKDKRIKQLEQLLLKKDKEIKKLNKKLFKSIVNEKMTLLSFIGEQKKLLSPKEEEIIEVEVKPRKKDKKSKKKNK